MDKTLNCTAIAEYQQLKGILAGILFETTVVINNKNFETIYDESTECRFSRNYGGLDEQIEFLWPRSAEKLLKLQGIHGSASTSYQSFEFDGERLIIKDNNIQIILY